jgi:hypothetical protein
MVSLAKMMLMTSRFIITNKRTNFFFGVRYLTKLPLNYIIYCNSQGMMFLLPGDRETIKNTVKLKFFTGRYKINNIFLRMKILQGFLKNTNTLLF